MLNAYIRRINNLSQSDQGLSLELVMPSYSCGVDVAVALSIRCLLESEASVRVSHNTKMWHRAILQRTLWSKMLLQWVSSFRVWRRGWRWFNRRSGYRSSASACRLHCLRCLPSCFYVLNDTPLDTLYRGVCSRTTYETVLSCQDLVLDEPFCRGSQASVFVGGDDGGSPRTPRVQTP
jgi:hypothetical protein